MRCIKPVQLGPQSVPCGKCNYCLQVKRMEWSFRLNQELKVSDTAHFLTLTYNESTVPYKHVVNSDGSEDDVPSLHKRDVQLFTKRLRKEQSYHTDAVLRYYTVGEYGTLGNRPHYHSIMFNMVPETVAKLPSIWGLGLTYIGSVTPASINYVTKYVINKNAAYSGLDPPFSLMSRRPGIGARYLQTHYKWHRDDMRNYAQVNGQLTRLPRFYKDRIFTKDEKFEMQYEIKQEMSLAAAQELKRLRKFHFDPSHYYQELLIENHDRITRSLNTKNKI